MGERPEWFKREDRDWEKVYSRYSLAQIPWHSDNPDRELIELIQSGKIKPYRALDIGCGAGTDAIYLASRGFSVTAIDISREAIKIARERAEEAQAIVSFIAGDFLEVKFDNDSFDFVNDRGCFHHMNPSRREDFAAELSRVLKNQGFYYLRCWSDKQERRGGAYSIPKDVIHNTFYKILECWGNKGFQVWWEGRYGLYMFNEKTTNQIKLNSL